MDYIVVGAGIIGLSVAYELTSRHSGNITVVSKDHVISGEYPSRISGGAFRFWHERDIYTKWVKESDRVIRKWKKSFDVPFYQIGVSWRSKDIEIIASDLVRNGIPFSYNDGWLYEPEGGHFDTSQTIISLISQLQDRGVKFINNCSVYEIISRKNYVKLQTNKGLFEAGKVVLAAGHQSYNLYGKIRGFKGEPEYASIVEGKRPRGLKDTVTIDLEANIMIVPNSKTVKIACGESIKGAYFSKSELEEVSSSTTRKFMAATGNSLKIDNISVGVYDNTKDNLPIVGYADDNVYVACGFNGSGFKYASFIGSAVAEELTKNIRSKHLNRVGLIRFANFNSVGV